MKKLKEHQIRFVVRRLAEFEEPEIIAVEFEELYDEQITVQDIQRLHPARNESENKKYLKYFFEVRKQLYAGALTPSIFKAVRIEKLRLLLKIAEEEDNTNITLRIHEQLQRETDPILKDLVKLFDLPDAATALEEYFA